MSERILYLEPVGGIAGDMFLAAAADLGVSLEAVAQQLETLGLEGWHFHSSRAERHQLVGTHVEVATHTHQPGHSHDEAHGAPSAHPQFDKLRHGSTPLPAPAEGHGHRPLSEIQRLIRASKLSEGAKAKALKVFELLGAAEAKIHGVGLEQVEFHEVGAVDSIVDICGAAVVLELLGNPTVYTAPPPLGSGTVRIAHGTVPVPGPATLEILRGVPVLFEGKGELTTPTGAALLKAFARFEAPGPMSVEKIGYGIGTKDWPDRANVLRATLGTASHSTAKGTLRVLECNLDDASPQLLGHLIETLIAHGALDAWVIPCTMKKGRPGHLLGALVEPARRDEVVQLLLRESTSLGIRETTVERTALSRRFETVTTRFGAIRIKVGFDGERELNAVPEYEDCLAAAQAAGAPLKQVMAEALGAYWSAKPNGE